MDWLWRSGHGDGREESDAWRRKRGKREEGKKRANRVFHAACAALTFCLAVSSVNGGQGGLGSSAGRVEVGIFLLGCIVF